MRAAARLQVEALRLDEPYPLAGLVERARRAVLRAVVGGRRAVEAPGLTHQERLGLRARDLPHRHGTRLPDDLVRPRLRHAHLLLGDEAVEVDRHLLGSEVEAQRPRRRHLHERAREEVLAVVLLHVIEPARAVHAAVDAVAIAGNRAVEDVEDRSVLLDHRDDRRAPERSRVPRLAAAFRVEGGAIEDNGRTIVVAPPRDHGGVELEEIGVLPVEPLSHQRGAIVSTYLYPVPVLNTTTTSSALRWPEDFSLRSAATAAPPSGAMKSPSVAEASFTPWTISASETMTPAPWLSRSARRIRKSPSAFGTRRPWASVCAFS